MRKRKIRKALLFIPPAFTFRDYLDINPLPPLGLGYIAAALELQDIEVKIVDCLMEGWHKRIKVDENIIRIGLDFNSIRKIIENYAPDIVGVNSLFTKQRQNAHKIYELAKEISEDIITVAGGAHPTVMPELVLSDKNIDYIILGEGEETIIDLINVIEGVKDISTLDGIGYREDREIRIIPKTKFILDLDKLPFPARHLLNMEKYFGLKMSHGARRKKKFSPIITSRGCPAKCTFCSAHRVWGRKFRQRSSENVIAEMKHIKERYGIEEIMFEDDNVTLNVKRAEKLFDLMIKERLGFVWDTPNGVAAWVLNEKLINKMKESGCYKLNLALESGSQYVLDNIIKKPLNLDKSKSLIRYAKKIGLDVGLYLIMGLAGETESQIMETFGLAKELEIYNPFISIATPYPGTELYDVCVKKGYLKDDFSLDDLFIRSFSISTEHWSSKRLQEIYRKGQMFLLVSFIRAHPFKFLFEFLYRFFKKLFTDPWGLVLKLYNFRDIHL